MPRGMMPWMLGILVIALGPAAPTFGHDLGAECKLRDGKVEVEAFFDDDTAPRDARVRVDTEDGKTLLRGRTDAKGRWSFPAPAPGKYRVTVDAGGGHRTTVKITIPGTPPTPPPAAPEEEPASRISEGPGRHDRAPRFPALALGLAVIGVAALGGWLLLRGRRTP